MITRGTVEFPCSLSCFPVCFSARLHGSVFVCSSFGLCGPVWSHVVPPFFLQWS